MKQTVKTIHTIEKLGYTFTVERRDGKPGKFEKELEKAAAILEKPADKITAADHIALLNIYNVAYHDGGKIAGISSLDSSATNCGLCQRLRTIAAARPELNLICGGCYDYSQEHSFKGRNVLNRHTLNMIIMSTVDFSVDELRILPASALNRVNSSGDAPNDIYAANMIKYAIAHDYARVTIWTKNVPAYIRACDTYGKPANVILIQSSCMIGKPAKLAKYFDYVFTVYKDADAVKKALAAGACECNGKKCMNCGYKCYFGTWENGANIAELLR